MTAPNIILIMTDQMRGDCLGIAGHPDVKTPYLDTLAFQGSLFYNAYSACPSCIPARAALFTGMSQRNHRRVGYEDGISWDYENMLPEVLSRNGYHTECVGKMHVHPPLRRCGFNNLALHDGYIGYYRRNNTPYSQHQAATDAYVRFLKTRCGFDADVNDTGNDCNAWITQPWVYDEMSHPTNWTVSESIAFLRRRDRSKPFFLMTSFVRPHPPFDAPQSYLSQYIDANLAPPAVGEWADNDSILTEGRVYDSAHGCTDEAQRKRAMAGYYACITQIDHQIGRLIQTLETELILEDTIIIFTSDHGELLFDHNKFRKVQPYQGSVRIPLIVRVGGNVRGGRQTRCCGALTELRDIMPSILDAAGIPAPDTVDGRSFFPKLFGDESVTREYIHGEHSYGELSNHYIVTTEDKFIWFSQTGRRQYFDLKADPAETRDLIDSPQTAGRVEYLQNLLIRELSGREENYTDGERLIAGRTPVNILRAGQESRRGMQ